MRARLLRLGPLLAMALPAIALLAPACGSEPGAGARIEAPRANETPCANEEGEPATSSRSQREAVSAPSRVSQRKPLIAPAAPARRETAALRLRLVDAQTGERFAGRVSLWRLGLPETEHMTAGDELAGEHDVPRNGLRLEGLEPGRYRASCPERRFCADDPPAFELTAPRTRVSLEVERPRAREAHVVLFDDAGARLSSAELHTNVPSSYSLCDAAPDWPVARRMKNPPAAVDLLDRRFGGGGRVTTCGGWRELRAGAHGFPLGSFDEDPADRRTVHTARLRARGEALSCRIEGRHLGELRYAALVPSAERVLASVRLADGGAASEVTPRVLLNPVVRRLEHEAPEDVWRALEVEVVVLHVDHERLEFRWSPATAHEPRWLEPRRADDAE